MKIQRNQRNHHLDSVADVVQHVVVDGLPDVPDGTLHVGRGDDLVGPQRALIGGQDADLPPGHLLLMDVHGLEETERGEREGGVSSIHPVERRQSAGTTGTSGSG